MTDVVRGHSVSLGRLTVDMARHSSDLAFTQYCLHQYCMVYGIKSGVGGGGGVMLRNGRAIVLQ